MSDLTDKQRLFVDEYLVDLNATQAAIRAGYSTDTARSIGSENLSKPDIQEFIAERMKDRENRTQITQDKVLKELAKLAFFDIRKIYDDSGNLIPITELDDDSAAAIVGIDVVEVKVGDSENREVEYTKKLKLADKRASLVDIGKHLGMFGDKVTATINHSGNVNLTLTADEAYKLLIEGNT